MIEEVARLQYRIEASTARFEANVKRAERLMTRSSKQIERSAGSVDARMAKLGARFGAVLGGLSAGVAVRGLDRMLTQLDNIGKTADRVGLTTEALQRLRSAAQQTGVNTRTLDMAMQRFSRRLAEARNGTGEARGVLEEMGIALTDTAGRARSNEDVLNDVADAMSQVDNETDALRIAFKLFDSEGAALVNTLRNGSGELERMKSAARGVIDDAAIRNAEALRNEIDLLGEAANNAALQIVGNLAKAINEVLDPGRSLREQIELGRNDPLVFTPNGVMRQSEIAGDTPATPSAGTSIRRSAGSVGNRTAFDDALGAQRADQRANLNRMQIEAIASDEERARKLRALEAELVEVRVADELRARAMEQNIALGMEAGTVTWEQEQAITGAALAAGQMAVQMQALDEAQQAQQASARQTAQTIDQIGDAFAGAIRQADSLGDAVKSLAFELAAIALKTGVTVGLNSLLANADGNAFQGGRVIPFARGGVVSRPTTFPMANGTGLMGEAGPEAIMPLKRGAGGKLGVAATGGGPVYNIDARGSTDPAATEAAVMRAIMIADRRRVEAERRR